MAFFWMPGCQKKSEPEVVHVPIAGVEVDWTRRGSDHAKWGALPAEVSPERFCVLYAGTVCRKIFACAEPESIQGDAEAHQFGDEKGCREALRGFCGAFVLAGVGESVKAGRVSWDGRGFGRCFQKWSDARCVGALGDLPSDPVCVNSGKGLVKPGNMCGSAFDCEEVPGREVLCLFRKPGDGICELSGRLGESCARVPCSSGLDCVDEICREVER